MVLTDPQEREIKALFDFVGDFSGLRVLEIGCGDGRLTWHYVGKTSFVSGIDPNEERIASAMKTMPAELIGRVEFATSRIESYQSAQPFDLAILSWSL
jgi:2-polyprenyl-3-methyl-5-hydroxy-6-metoxy-1,4-benzoquinol methylase